MDSVDINFSMILFGIFAITLWHCLSLIKDINKVEKENKDLNTKIQSTPDLKISFFQKVSEICKKNSIPLTYESMILKSVPSSIIALCQKWILKVYGTSALKELAKAIELERRINIAQLERQRLTLIYNKDVLPLIEEERRLAAEKRRREEAARQAAARRRSSSSGGGFGGGGSGRGGGGWSGGGGRSSGGGASSGW